MAHGGRLPELCYALSARQNLPGVFRTFDFASPDASNPQRYQTTVPQQALFLLNHPFVQEQARTLAKRSSAAKEPERVQRLYRDIYARSPDAEEARIALEFVEKSGRLPSTPNALTPWETLAQALLVANEFAFID